MKTIYISILKIIFFIMFLISCTNSTTSLEAEDLFTEIYKDCTMNKLLKLGFIGGLYEGDISINLSLESTTNLSVMFPNDNNVTLLSFDSNENKWIEVENNIQYLPIDAKYIIGENDPIKEHSYQLIEIIPSLGKQTDLRVVVHGNIYENGVETDTCAGAFVDIVFTP